MKRIISGILAILMIASIGFGAFAAPSVDKVVGASTPNGGYIFYIFGKGVSENATEAGITIEGKDENYKLQYFPASEEDTLQDALVEGKYGIGINDSKNLLGNTFRAAPYEIVNDEKIVGEYVTINKGEAETADYAGLSKLFINGKAAPGFYTGTPETDFYYGLEELPETAEGLPAIEIASNHGELVKGEVESYYGGYTVPYSVEYTNINGNVLNKTFKIHFREFSDKVVTVSPDSAYRVHLTYFDESKVDMMNLKEQTSDFYMSLNTASDVPSNQDTYLYVTYDVDEIEDYAPVSYDLTGLRARYNPFDIYSYDGDLSNVVFPKTEGEALEQRDMFLGFKGYNPVSEFLLMGTDADTTDVNELGVVASTTSVKEGNNILIFRSRLPQIGSNPAQIIYTGASTRYQLKLNVRYVEKNPVDITMNDATLKTVKINGVKAEGYDEKTGTFYTGVESFEKFDFDSVNVTAETNITDATVKYGTFDKKFNSLPITVTAKDGVSIKEYTLIFKEIQHTKINSSYFPYLHYEGGYSSGNYNADAWMRARRPAEEMETENTTVGYAEFSTASLKNFVIAGKSYLNATPKYNATYLLYNTTNDTISNKNTFDEIVNEDADLLGSFTCPDDGKATNPQKIELDGSLLKINSLGNIYIGLVSKSGNAILEKVSAEEPVNLELGYITLEPNEEIVDPDDTDVSIASVKINGEEALYYDEATKTFYTGVDNLETYDFVNCDIEVVPTVAGADAFGAPDPEKKIGAIEVTSRDGSKKEEYTIKFKEIQHTKINSSYFPYLHYEGGYSSGNYNADAWMRARRPAEEMETDSTTVGYAEFSTASLKNFVIAGKSYLNATPKYDATYLLYNTLNDTISNKNTFDEIVNEDADLLGSFTCPDDGAAKTPQKIELDGSLLKINSLGNIYIGLVSKSGNAILEKVSDTEPVNLELGYITID